MVLFDTLVGDDSDIGDEDACSPCRWWSLVVSSIVLIGRCRVLTRTVTARSPR